MTKVVGKVPGFDVVIIEDETVGYVAFVLALPGCHTQGETIEETIENVKEAIELYLETLNTDFLVDSLRKKDFIKKFPENI